MRFPVDWIAIVRGKSKSHNGLDLGFYSNAHKYQPVYACEEGEVIYKKIQPNGGKTLVIKHKGCCSVYAHLDSWCVSVGDKVKLGKKIGTMGESGNVTGQHLHFSLVKGDKVTFTSKDNYLNPCDYLCVFKNQHIKNLKTKLMVKYYTKKVTEDLWIHDAKDFTKHSRVYSVKKGTEISYYGKDGNYALVDKMNKYWCSKKYLK